MQPDEDVRAVTLASAIDFEGFRRACRALWADQVGPDRVSWSTAQDPEADLFAAAANAAAASTAPTNASRSSPRIAAPGLCKFNTTADW